MSLFSPYRKPILIFIIYLSISLFLTRCQSQPILMTKQIGQLIFQQHKYFIIYVAQQNSQKVLQLFNQYCKDRQNCAILNNTVDEYQSVRKFIGKTQKQFFLILNVPFHKKYVLDINDQTGLNKDDLIKFQKQYEQQTLAPFYASQPIPENTLNYCKQLVGKTYNDFINQSAILKIIYTYTKHQACGGCIPLLKDFLNFAQKHHSKDVIFGYVDVFLNDIPEISQPIVPHFYVYKDNKIIKEIDQADWEDVPSIIQRYMKENGIIYHDDDSDSSSEDQSKQQEL